jgi:hypothetical protein
MGKPARTEIEKDKYFWISHVASLEDIVVVEVAGKTEDPLLAFATWSNSLPWGASQSTHANVVAVFFM